MGKALASPLRLLLLDLLAQAGRSVDDLAAEVGARRANTSAQLQVLHGAALVSSRKEGTRVYYRLASDDVARLVTEPRSVGHAQLAEVERAARDYLGDLTTLEPVTREELSRALGTGRLFLLDVRPSVAHGAGHIPGAHSLPLRRARRPSLGASPRCRDRRVLPRTLLRLCPGGGAPVAGARLQRPPPEGRVRRVAELRGPHRGGRPLGRAPRRHRRSPVSGTLTPNAVAPTGGGFHVHTHLDSLREYRDRQRAEERRIDLPTPWRGVGPFVLCGAVASFGRVQHCEARWCCSPAVLIALFGASATAPRSAAHHHVMLPPSRQIWRGRTGWSGNVDCPRLRNSVPRRSGTPRRPMASVPDRTGSGMADEPSTGRGGRGW